MACDVVTTSAPLNLNVIGPRSVIVPADPIIWDAETSYEYLTLVASTDFGQGYVSKKDVPAGTPLTNTDYWIPVASYNAQLAAIQEDMAQFNTGLDGKAPTAHASAETTYGVGSASEYGHVKLSDTLESSNAAAGIAATPSMVKGVADEHSVLVVIGDSWSNSDSTPKWPEMTADYYGLTLDNFAQGGAGFVAGTTFGKQLEQVIAKYQDSPNLIGKFVIQGMVNDLENNASAIQTAVSAFINRFTSVFPDVVADVVMCSMFPSISTQGVDNIIVAMNSFVLNRQFVVHDLIGCVSVNNMMEDGRHPSNTGYGQLANFINGANYTYPAPATHFFTNGYARPTFNESINIDNEQTVFTGGVGAWTISFTVSSQLNNNDTFIDFSNNPLLYHAARYGFASRIPIYSSDGIAAFIGAKTLSTYVVNGTLSPSTTYFCNLAAMFSQGGTL